MTKQLIDYSERKITTHIAQHNYMNMDKKTAMHNNIITSAKHHTGNAWPITF